MIGKRYKFIGAQLKIDRLIDGKRHIKVTIVCKKKERKKENTVRENGFFSTLRSQRDTSTDTHTHTHTRKEEEEKTAHDEITV